jgi:hypothetical protein
MYRRHLQATLAAVLAVCFLLVSSLVYAEESYTPPLADETPEPTAEAMLVDLVFLRPLGFAATVVGSVAFVAGLIFSVPTKSVDTAAKKLVVAPAKYTFVRPFGHTDFGLGYERQHSGDKYIRQ